MKRLFSALFSLGLFFTGAAAMAHDNVRYLADGDQALTQLVSSIRGARKSIDVTYFIYDLCGIVGNTLTDEMAKAVQRGVKVRVLVDAYTHDEDMRDLAVAFFESKGIEIRYYNIAQKWNPQGNLRSHIKLFVFDGSSYVTGGRNIADDYYGFSSGTNWIDRDVFVQGSSAPQADRGFNELWDSRNTQKVPSSLSTSAKIEQFKTCTDKFKAEKKRLLARLDGDWSRPLPAKQYRCNGRFVSDSPSFADGVSLGVVNENHVESYLSGERLRMKRMSAEIIVQFGSARTEIFSENWGYLPQADIRMILNAKRDQGVQVMIITNRSTEGYGPTDLILRHRALNDSRGSMSILAIPPEKIRAPRHALTPAESVGKYHSKVYTIDRKGVIVSSWNMDPRSHHTNLESGWASNNCPQLALDIQKETAKSLLTRNAGREPWTGSGPSLLEQIKAWASHEFL